MRLTVTQYILVVLLAILIEVIRNYIYHLIEENKELGLLFLIIGMGIYYCYIKR